MNSTLRNRSRAVLIWVACLALPLTAHASDPIGDFFRRLGNSISNAGKRQPPRHPTAKPAGKPEKDATDSEASPSPAAGASISATPMQTVRAATIAPAANGRRRDVPYGIPVPNKPGFVTSPYAPSSGLVDVRGFPTGTEVTDPYTRKIFLTP